MRHRSGVTLIELMVALALFSVLLTTTLAFYQRQGDAFTEGNDRMAVMQNLRYAVNDVEQSLRTAGVGVPTEQPVIVYADADVVAFNADYATNRTNDFFAVFQDPALPDAAVGAVGPDRAFTIPRSGFTYPATAYFAGSGNSPAETIVLYFAPDTTTPRTDDYALYRQVNGLEPDVVADTAAEVAALDGLDLRGLMTMARFGAPEKELRATFARVRELRDRAADGCGCPLPELSMGMTQDYEAAVAEGATLVRIGTAIFGERPAP